MLRKLLIGFGILEILAPKPIIDACERIGLENPNTAELRSEALALARLEGLMFVWLLIRGRERSPILSTVLGLTGTLAVIYPRPLIRFSQVFAYNNPRDLELRPWVEPAARLLGVLYLIVVFFSGSTNSDTDERDDGETVTTETA